MSQTPDTSAETSLDEAIEMIDELYDSHLAQRARDHYGSLSARLATAEAETAKLRSALDRIEYTAEHATPITADYIQNNDVLPDWLGGDTPLVPVELLAKAEAKRDAAITAAEISIAAAKIRGVKLGLEWAASVCDRALSKQNQTGGNLEAESAHWCAAAIRTAAADPARVAQIAKGERE